MLPTAYEGAFYYRKGTFDGRQHRPLPAGGADEVQLAPDGRSSTSTRKWELMVKYDGEEHVGPFDVLPSVADVTSSSRRE